MIFSWTFPLPPHDVFRKKVNFAVRTPAALQYHASYPGARSRGGHPSVSPQPRRSRSHSPHSPRLQRQSPRRRDRSPSSYCLSDSESSGGPYLFSEDELSTSPVSGFSSSSPTPRRHRSSSPVGRSGSPSQSAGRSLRNPPAQRRHFYLADADPELVESVLDCFFPDYLLLICFECIQSLSNLMRGLRQKWNFKNGKRYFLGQV